MVKKVAASNRNTTAIFSINIAITVKEPTPIAIDNGGSAQHNTHKNPLTQAKFLNNLVLSFLVSINFSFC